ncbi:MAG: TMEM175 family protein [Gemmatimonadota bacterium]
MSHAPGQFDTTRLEAFSDGVFAIAITLLVLEIRVPSHEAILQDGGLWHALLRLWPSYLGYLISFVTIGIMWANHHSVFEQVRHADRYFLMINVLFLLCISFLPFPTAVLAAYLPDLEQRTIAVAAYGATLIVISLAYNALWWYAIRGERLLGPDADAATIRVITLRYGLGPFAYAIAFGLAFVNVWASLAVHGVLAAVYLLPEKHAASGRPRGKRATESFRSGGH